MLYRSTSYPLQLLIISAHGLAINELTRIVTFEHMGTEVLKIDKRDDNLKVTSSSARFLLKLIEGEAKDEITGICFVHATATGAVHLKEII